MTKQTTKAIPKPWTDADNKLLIELFPTATSAVLEEKLNRSAAAIKSRAGVLKLLKAKSYKLWTEDEDALLIKLFPDTLTSEIAAQLGRTQSSVEGRAWKLKVGKSLAYMQKLADSSKLRIVGAAYRYPKGHIPANKGVRGVSYPGMEVTQFKPGAKPLNWKPVGSIRICSKDGYILMKMAEGMFQWKPIHRIIWERMHGAVPAGHVVHFIDDNKLNISITNLSIISLKQNVLRNSVHNHGPEIAELYRLKAQISRQINKRTRINHGE